MAVRLASPNGDDLHPYAADWYLERREDGHAIDVCRPLFQGDVFVGVPLAGVPFTGTHQPDGDGEALADAVMLVGHPCSMVSGAEILPYQEVARVRPTKPVSYDRYDDGRFEEFFLPCLDLARTAVHYSACLHERTLVPTEQLRLGNRVAALSLTGVVALQQRLTHESSRVKVDLNTLLQATAPRFHENQLAQEWNSRFVDPDALDEPTLLIRLAEEARAFDAALKAPVKAKDETSGYVLASTLRQEMFDPSNEGRVTLAVRKHMKLRRNALDVEKQKAQARAAKAAAAARDAPPKFAGPPDDQPTGVAPDEPSGAAADEA